MREEATLLHQLVLRAANSAPERAALRYVDSTLSYAQLAEQVRRFSDGLIALRLQRGERVAIYLEKRFETVIAAFGAAASGAAFVPVNPLLKAEQVGHILRDCNVRVLVTSPERLALLRAELARCGDLRHLVLTEGDVAADGVPGIAVHRWEALLEAPAAPWHRVIDIDMAAILYTSGSTGKPKG
ncbi:MAG: AMP-binding protein, partial [Sutterellaceae bacterium]|nr:long-chain fatty acid--CoA ligase [Burkholderiaceae bacterium]MDW8429679.1 AMP-binding protein [Sutterellaceae bacterium]